VLDYHVHLWPHELQAEPAELRLDRLRLYCERANANGVAEIALTEHLFRFKDVEGLLASQFRDEQNHALGSQMAEYFGHHATEELEHYVDAVLEAKAAGLPVVLGLEVDYYPGKMAEVGELLAGYPFDVLLGSVHWLGGWMFDVLSSAAVEAEWEHRGTEAAWRAYTDAICELAESSSVDVLAHPDVIKVTGRRPGASQLEECHERIADATEAAGLAAEISSSGWRKPAEEAYPAPSLLAAFARRSVPVTTASDTHGLGNLAERGEDLMALAKGAGYQSLRAFVGRRGHDVPLESPVGERSASPVPAT
jgi:histidinol-phosphatase (PHP family)